MIVTGRNKTRMAHWILLAMLVYAMAALLASFGPDGTWPRAQTVLWKAGHMMVGAYLGYAADRSLFRDRIHSGSSYHLHLRRAIITAAFILGMAVAL